MSGLTEEQKKIFINEYNNIATQIKKVADDKGWIMKNDHQSVVEKIALIICELCEAIEWLRIGNPKSDHIKEFSGLEEELADAIIRIMGLGKRLNINVAEALIEKIKFNKQREFKHGNKLF